MTQRDGVPMLGRACNAEGAGEGLMAANGSLTKVVPPFATGSSGFLLLNNMLARS
jgi:hypothetical protein